MTSTKPPHIAHTLLSRAHSPTTTERIFTEKVRQKPLYLRPSSPDPKSPSARTARRLARLRKKEHFLRHQKPRPLSAKEKRKLGVHDLPEEARRWEIYVPLHELWVGYMQEILGLGVNVKDDEKGERGGSGVYVTAQSVGSKLASADFHGAEVEVVRSRCVGRVGARGIVVRDTKFTFEIVTPGNELKTIPKEHTIFKFEIPRPGTMEKEDGSVEGLRNLVFELHGSQFENRAPDRATKKFKQRNLSDL